MGDVGQIALCKKFQILHPGLNVWFLTSDEICSRIAALFGLKVIHITKDTPMIYTGHQHREPKNIQDIIYAFYEQYLKPPESTGSSNEEKSSNEVSRKKARLDLPRVFGVSHEQDRQRPQL